MKRTFGVTAMSLLLALSMTACSGGGASPAPAASTGGQEEGQETSQAQAPEGDLAEEDAADASTLEGWGSWIKEQYDGTKIVVSMASHPSTEAFQAMAEEFTDLTGIQVEWDVVEQTYLKNKQLLDFQGAHSYDVFMVDSFWNAEYGAKNVVQPLDAYLNDSQMTPDWYDKEDLIPAYCDLGQYQGKTIGIPIAGETRFLAYRTDLFEKYGKEAPKTMDEFLELARFFNGKEEGLYGVALRAQRGIHFASGWLTTMYAFCDGMMDQETLEPKIDDPGVVESLQWYLDMLECAPPDVSTYTHEEALGAFMSGKTAMWLDATAIAGAITDPEQSKIYDKVAFAAPPDGPAGESAALADWNISIPAGAKNPEAAWAFMMYMTSREKSLEYVKNGGAATRYSVYENEELVAENPSYPAQLAALEKANGLVKRGLQWTPPHEQINQMLDIMGSYASRAQAGEMTAQEACEKAQADVEDLLQ